MVALIHHVCESAESLFSLLRSAESASSTSISTQHSSSFLDLFGSDPNPSRLIISFSSASTTIKSWSGSRSGSVVSNSDPFAVKWLTPRRVENVVYDVRLTSTAGSVDMATIDVGICLCDGWLHLYKRILIGSPNYGHGLAFFLAPVGLEIPPNSVGGFLGLFNTTNSDSSQNQIVHVEFDSFVNQEWDPTVQHVRINNNSISSAVYTTWNASLQRGDTANVSIIYNTSVRF
ncbi:uncharacterized protein LOC136065128 [Quercus suber]|uniref:uncharacterized protein LOC136065128 n=1 Tax=Quercus suber TaxID=58331 RepID=UPI0032DEA119